MREIQQKYFNPVKEWSKDYEVIGKIFALSILQNGTLPRILTTDLLEELFEKENPREFVKDLRMGLDSLGLFQLVKSLPPLVHLFTPSPSTPVTFKMITTILRPEFSEEGSNRRKRENRVYSKFIKYMREAASGRRGDVNLAKILKFGTSVEEEPILGFSMHPSLHFSERISYLPTANTCINRITLTVPETEDQLPEDNVLFNLFDYAFCNTYYGLQ
ncbi:uncharacterized protein LOC127738473 [Mytilus californianus]|uniref:uncharacterized protein LOC127738473 n=1 Tax=Mytilus californianus TaxID=6549 RepID=UPI002244FEB0|nr:uncharacterized protein LOC127738473 [Mytilus californianus]